MSSQTLYQRLLGEDFQKLPPILQCFHSQPQGAKASGRVNVKHASSSSSRSLYYPAAMAGTLLGLLPPQGEDIPLRLEVVPEQQGQRELWIRHFGNKEDRQQRRRRYCCLRTLQWTEDGTFLVEQAGPLLFVFRVSADEKGMTFHFQHNRLPLPGNRARFTALHVEAVAAIAPGATADERFSPHNSPGNDSWRISVQITSPMLGQLTAYEGVVTPALR